MAYSDEPVLVAPTRRWSAKTIAAILFVAAVVGGILYIPLFQHNLDEAAHDSPRGPHNGALYTITVANTPHTLELGWIAPAFSAALTPAPAPGATLEVLGDFGSETLAWNPETATFGPGRLRLEPYGHHKVKLTLRLDGRVLWTGTLWAYGIHDTHGH